MVHNLLKGVPFEHEQFDLVYHSHVLEHFAKDDGQKLIKECSLTLLLKKCGFRMIEIKTAFTSNLPNWREFELDCKNEYCAET